ncbi:2,3-bisphosphoglycerate-dependent phosphoglycerate mutase [Ramlibacter sp. Leaf400]|uniref:2,3-bisphosphoglycerate-dependent phosphoglycerate mutase n=1 Tax=Ramlibacter sp. Leaf400 TaxID=1736365 RepID=UPI0006FCF74C|nr:2,3-bisphosphoglycerate-dependent phosphoglycerate mutase [Ramlibacter sp. Leaf400]KQT11627.1 hypothetical protein ASG30_04735 [Ramlibacter sp. Leaf400]
MPRLVLMRHGESTANLDGTFAGWLDVPLTATGIAQARTAGRALRAAGLAFDRCYTSALQRSIESASHTLDEMGGGGLPVEPSWRLNERHYGVLQGRDKAEAVRTYGAEQVRLWRRSWAERPPQGESMQDTVLRVQPLWDEQIAPRVAQGQRVLIVAHGTTLRAFAVILGEMGPAQAEATEVPNALPVVYELDAGLQVRASHALAAGTRSDGPAT